MKPTYVVTGAAGFIGSNLVKGLNDRGITDIIAVDDLTQADKFKNLTDCDIADYLDFRVFIKHFEKKHFGQKIQAILHEGASSNTMETDGHYMMENNYRYSVTLLNGCQEQAIPFLYASSAAVYGGGSVFKEERRYECPLNVYGYSKFLMDQVVRKRLQQGTQSQIAGFRYFNVYGPKEYHKDKMASVAFHHFNQFEETGNVRLFEGCQGYTDGEQRRDFVWVGDVVKANLFFLDHPEKSGIFNIGTGRAQSFNDVAVSTINALKNQDGTTPAHLTLGDLQSAGLIQYIPFPPALKGKYQAFTQADLSTLRQAGYNERFLSVEEGVSLYMNWLKERAP